MAKFDETKVIPAGKYIATWQKTVYPLYASNILTESGENKEVVGTSPYIRKKKIDGKWTPIDTTFIIKPKGSLKPFEVIRATPEGRLVLNIRNGEVKGEVPADLFQLYLWNFDIPVKQSIGGSLNYLNFFK